MAKKLTLICFGKTTRSEFFFSPLQSQPQNASFVSISLKTNNDIRYAIARSSQRGLYKRGETNHFYEFVACEICALTSEHRIP